MLPKTRTDVYLIFGNPGRGRVDPAWERANMLTAHSLPGSWNKGAQRLYVHRKAEPYLREALAKCETEGCLDEIRTMGCFNFRHQRHDPKRPLSYHSWGIAIDINSADNAPKTIPRKLECFSPEWLELWPKGVSPSLVSAWESAGWKWGGRWRGWCDPMHWELTA